VNHGYPDGYGDTVWSLPTPRGTLDNIFVENCSLLAPYNSNANTCDCYQGGSYVARFNHLDAYGSENHATVALRSRGGRHMEVYCNHVTDAYANPAPGFCVIYQQSGTMFCWGNSIDGMQYVVVFRTQRVNNATYGNGTTPNVWGFGGTTGHWVYGLVSTSGTTVTKNSGNNFFGGVGSQAWTVNNGALVNINGTEYTVSSLTDSTHLQLTSSAGTQTNVPFWPVTNWDAKEDGTGYLMLDQPGAGEGDLLSGDFPSCINTERSNHGYTFTDAHPHQAHEPMYIFKNPRTNPQGSYFANSYPSVIVENRDYFVDSLGATGTPGVLGEGNASAMNASGPTIVNQGFWRTDLGNWNLNTDTNFYTGQGQLWAWNGSSWGFHYQPAQYPHPEVLADAGIVVGTRLTRKGRISRGRH